MALVKNADSCARFSCNAVDAVRRFKTMYRQRQADTSLWIAVRQLQRYENVRSLSS